MSLFVNMAKRNLAGGSGFTETRDHGVVTTRNGRAIGYGGGGGGGSMSIDDVRQGKRQTRYLGLQADRQKGLAEVDVEMAERAMEDAARDSARAAQVLSSGGNREVGGGAFSRLRGRRGGVQLGGLVSGGLAAANRAKLAEVKRKAIDTAYNADFEALTRADRGLSSAAFKQMTSPKGLVKGGFKQTLNDVGQIVSKKV